MARGARWEPAARLPYRMDPPPGALQIDTPGAARDSRRLVLRYLIAAALASLSTSSAAQIPAPAPQTAAPAPKTSEVFFAQDESTFGRASDNPDRVRAMVQALVFSVTGQTDWAKAWRTLVAPTDRVGIKISTVGGRGFSTHPAIVATIVSGLEAAGVPRGRIVVWDRNSEDLRAAGFLPRTGRYDGLGDRLNVRAIDPPRGFDREAEIVGTVVGKLMWGDLIFVEKQRVKIGQAKNEGDQLSSSSYLARIVSRDVTKIINVPVLSDERGCGVAGAIYNMTIPNVDNWRRYTQTEGAFASSPAEIFADERIAPKCVLHIMDGLLAQYAGGPGFSPGYTFQHETIYASKDPVALDTIALGRIEEWRAQAKLPSIAGRSAWLKDAASLGLGNAAAERIVLQPVALPR